MSRTVITGAMIATMNPGREVLNTGHVVVDGNLIVSVGEGSATLNDGDVVVDAHECLILPGFVNTHHHLASTLQRGLVPDHPLGVKINPRSGTLMLHRVQGEDGCFAGSMLAFAELTRTGVTTTTDSQSPWKGLGKNDGSLRAAKESGMRVIHSPAFVNRSEMVPAEFQFSSVAEAVAEFERLRAVWSNDFVSVIPEVMSLPRGTDDLIQSLFNAGDGRMAMHVTYSPGVAKWAVEEYGCTAIEHLDRLGVLGPGFLGAHPVYLSDAEIELYARRGATGAYCAVDNMLIAVGHLPMKKFSDVGVPMGLGLDYPNHTHNFFETMKVSLIAQKQLMGDAGYGDAGLALEWATIDGARALGLGDQIGSLEVGKRADLQIIDINRTHLSPRLGTISLLVYSGSPDCVRDVMADGNWLMRDRTLTHLNESEVLAEANAAQRKIVKDAGIPVAPVLPLSWSGGAH